MSTYAKLTFGCPPRGNALTNNAKFIAPFNEVYFEQTPPMMLYPGGFYPRKVVPTPKFQKAWNIPNNCASCNNSRPFSRPFLKSRPLQRQIMSSLDAIGTEN